MLMVEPFKSVEVIDGEVRLHPAVHESEKSLLNTQ
jgi:hypothetical protein